MAMGELQKQSREKIDFENHAQIYKKLLNSKDEEKLKNLQIEFQNNKNPEVLKEIQRIKNKLLNRKSKIINHIKNQSNNEIGYVKKLNKSLITLNKDNKKKGYSTDLGKILDRS